MRQTLAAPDGPRFRPIPLQVVHGNPDAGSKQPLGTLHHLTTVRGATTKIAALFGKHDAAPDAAAGDSRSALALRGWLVQSLLLEAIMRDDAGDLTAAGQALERALELAEHDRVLLPFTIDPVPALLEQHGRTRTKHTALITEILHLLTGLKPPTRVRATESMPDPLTESEARILRYLPTNLSNREIAHELYVSPHTIKSHVKHIYTKLGAHNRREAIQRAREYGLLGSSSRRLRAVAV